MTYFQQQINFLHWFTGQYLIFVKTIKERNYLHFSKPFSSAVRVDNNVFDSSSL